VLFKDILLAEWQSQVRTVLHLNTIQYVPKGSFFGGGGADSVVTEDNSILHTVQPLVLH
jgi:hypothetical protein